jgi:sulfur carrier protein
MRVMVNQVEHEVPQGALVSQVLEQVQAKPPFAVAVNLQFLPKTKYADYTLQENDQIEVIAPVTGG